MSDIFSDAHRAKAIADRQRQEAADHERMVERATAKGAAAGKPKPVERGYQYSGPFWGAKLG